MADNPANPESGTYMPCGDIDINFVSAPLQQSLPPITFMDRDFRGINPVNQDNHVVISIIIANLKVSRVLTY